MTTTAMRRRQVARRVYNFRAGVVAGIETWTRRARAGLTIGAKTARLAAVPASIVCVAEAITSLPAAEVGDLFKRSVAFTAPDGRPIDLHLIPAVVTWPLQAAYAVGRPAALHSGPQGSLLIWLGSGAALIVLSNTLLWNGQNTTNRATRAAVMIWAGSLALNMFDIFRVAVLPASWDTSELLTSLPNGVALRWAEIAASTSLLSFYSVMHANRVAPHIVGPFAKLMNPVRRGLTWRVAVMAAALPWVLRHLPPVFALLTDNRTVSALVAHVMVAIFLGLVAWRVLLAGIAKHLGSLISLGWQIVKMQPPIRKENSPPASPNRGN
jgi:hypothetical protein